MKKEKEQKKTKKKKKTLAGATKKSAKKNAKRSSKKAGKKAGKAGKKAGKSDEENSLTPAQIMEIQRGHTYPDAVTDELLAEYRCLCFCESRSLLAVFVARFFLHIVTRTGNSFTGVNRNQIQYFNGILFRRTFVGYFDVTQMDGRAFRPQTLRNGAVVGPKLELKDFSKYLKVIDPEFAATMKDKNLIRDVAEISAIQDCMLLLWHHLKIQCVCVCYGQHGLSRLRDFIPP